MATLPTPALLVDEARLARALAGMRQLAAGAGVRLRPHAKSHKCPELGRRQEALGAVGLCTAKVSEASVFAAAGFEDLTVVYPLVGPKADALAGLAARFPRARFGAAADSEAGVEALAGAARKRGVSLDLWLKIDSGLHRAGLEPGDPRLEALARRARGAPGLRLRGLVTHGGHAYAAPPEAMPAIGRGAAEAMLRARDALAGAGILGLEIALGATPTIRYSARVAGVDEIHPGVYVFGDRQQAALGAMTVDEASLTVLATVVSRPAPGRWVVDAGSKTLSSDRGAHGSEAVRGFGAARPPGRHRAPGDGDPLPFAGGPVPREAGGPDPREGGGPDPREAGGWAGAALLTRLSEEHGVIESDRDPGWEPGDRVEILPNHACAAVNLARTLHLTAGEGEDRRVVAAWPVAAAAHTA